MSSVNLCTFIGYMAADPETRAMPNGDTVANFRIACGESWKDKQTGERKEKTEWVSCVAWRKLAEIIGEYGRKGMQVYVAGKFTTRKWQDKQGNDRWTTEILVDTFTMLGKKSDNEGTGPRAGGQDTGGQGNYQQGSGGNTGNDKGGGGFDDDIPF